MLTQSEWCEQDYEWDTFNLHLPYKFIYYWN